MGMFESISTDDAETWGDLLENLRMSRGGFESMDDFLLVCAEDDPDEALRFRECLNWLGMIGSTKIASHQSLIEMFCQRLEEKLKYEENERDMVVMHHTIGAEFDDGSIEEHHSSLQAFGDRSMSAMCKTVGYTAAASTEVVLNGSLKGTYGLLLPTRREIYLPILDIVKREGIVFEETVSVEPRTLVQQNRAI
jgi:hypothetical protein